MSDAPRTFRLGRHGGHRQPKAATADQGNDNTLKSRGTGKQYILARLERDQRFDLLDAISQREITCFAAAVEAGYAQRRKTSVVGGDHNLTRQRGYAMETVLGKQDPVSAFASGALPCFRCRESQAHRALMEVEAVFLAVQRGEKPQRLAPGMLPRSCCRRHGPVDVRALIA